jgi:folylpolyglutamate synthase/dihydropteroate synthase
VLLTVPKVSVYVYACRYGDVPLTVIFGAAADKNVSSMLQLLTAHCCDASAAASATDTTTATASGVRTDTASSLLLVTAKHPRAASAAQLAAAAAAAATTDNTSDEQQQQQLVDISVHDALLSALSSAGKARVVLVCGSLVVAAEARAALYKHWPALFAATDWVHHAEEDTTAA